MTRVAINGLGRIGRLILRQYIQATCANENTDNELDFQIVAANDIASAQNMAYLLKYDSAHGRLNLDVNVDNNTLTVSDKSIVLFQEADPANLPWKDLGVDIVLECSGKFRTRALASLHLQAGANHVIIGASAEEVDLTVVIGVNDTRLNPNKHKIISNASCTTNSLAPVLKLLIQAYGIEHALVTTIHAYTISQAMVDRASNKMIRGRAGAVNIIPTATGADTATIAVLPELKNRLSALAVRVPVVNGSLTDISVQLKSPVSVSAINQLFNEASQNALKGILGYTQEPLVSSDIVGDTRSCIVHAQSTRVVSERAVKLQIWYDNEFAYAKRCLELVERLSVASH